MPPRCLPCARPTSAQRLIDQSLAWLPGPGLAWRGAWQRGNCKRGDSSFLLHGRPYCPAGGSFGLDDQLNYAVYGPGFDAQLVLQVIVLSLRRGLHASWVTVPCRAMPCTDDSSPTFEA